MVKRYYIQDYPQNFRGNSETRTIASDFIQLSIESSITRREKKTYIRYVVRPGGFLQVGSFHVILAPGPKLQYVHNILQRWAIITYKHGIYELPHELPNNFRLKDLSKLRYIRKVSKLNRMRTQCSDLLPRLKKKKIDSTSKKVQKHSN